MDAKTNVLSQIFSHKVFGTADGAIMTDHIVTATFTGIKEIKMLTGGVSAKDATPLNNEAGGDIN